MHPGAPRERVAQGLEELTAMRAEQTVTPAIVVAGHDHGRHITAERTAHLVVELDEAMRRHVHVDRGAVEDIAGDREHPDGLRAVLAQVLERRHQLVEDDLLLARAREQVKV